MMQSLVNNVYCLESECMCEYSIVGIEAHVPIGTRAEKYIMPICEQVIRNERMESELTLGTDTSGLHTIYGTITVTVCTVILTLANGDFYRQINK